MQGVFFKLYLHVLTHLIFIEHALYVLGSVLDSEDILLTKSNLALYS